MKTRLGWDQESIVILDAARMLEQAGVQALALHCRTRDQGHRGDVQWDWLAKLKDAVSIPIIGNGDVTTPEDAERMLQTGCDGVMIGRGAIANPWIFAETKHYLETGRQLPDATLQERVAVCMKHLRLSVEYKGERKGVVEFRKYYSGYLKGQRNAAKLRAELMHYGEVSPVLDLLAAYAEDQEAICAAA